jgi:16S rRNA (cytosine1402-N4)-methyltransferase
LGTNYHIPVLLKASVDALNIKPEGNYVDATYGGGGHAREILNRMQGGTLIAFDRDAEAEFNVPNDKRLIFVRNNFRFLSNFLRYNGIDKVDGILADLGVSSHDFDTSERGFSFRFPDAVLDMRMNRNASMTAQHIVNTYSAENLKRIFKEYGEIENAGKLTASLLKARESERIVTMGDLISSISACIPKNAEKQYLAKLCQALRIETNGEIKALHHFLEQTVNVLNTGGRLAVISYHSLEDKPVKNMMRTGNLAGVRNKDFYGTLITPFKLINSKAIVPSDEEIASNPRARSAKLRVAEKLQ